MAVPPRQVPGRKALIVFRAIVAASLVAAFGQVTLGGIVRVTGSGLGCPDWPLCHGRIIPPAELPTLIEYSHRLSASALVVLVVAGAGMAWWFYRKDGRVLIPSLLGVALVVAAALLGAATVWTELAWWIRLVHLGIAQAVVGCAVFSTAASWSSARPAHSYPPAGQEHKELLMLVLGAAAGVFILILAGSHMVGYGAGTACNSWPLCGATPASGVDTAVHMGHRALAAIIGVLVIATAIAAWSQKKYRPSVAVAGLALAVLFAAQVLVGAGMVWGGFATELKAAHLSLATLTWIALMFLTALVYSPELPEPDKVELRAEPVSKLKGVSP